jgi:glyoxylase-like metal-dependent hydrolase (beta-lactamase superfamily II)
MEPGIFCRLPGNYPGSYNRLFQGSEIEADYSMKNSILSVTVVLAVLCGSESFGAAPRFEKVGDHCYYLQLEEKGANVAVVVSEEGILIVDPPESQDLSLVVDALGRLSSKAVRWIAFTNPRFVQTAGTRYFAERGALLLAGARLQTLAESERKAGSEYPDAMKDWLNHVALAAKPSPFRWLIFDEEMRLFPSDLEVRITAIPHRARTGGDTVVYVPAEKVLFVGDLYESARYPDIDTASDGSALEWINGVAQVIDSVPVLKSAIPEEGSEAGKEEEKTLEEGIAVVSSSGEVSNLQNMKDLLEACQRLERYVKRAVDRGRSYERFLTLASTGPYYSYGNLAAYTAQLFEELGTPAEKKQ